MASSLGSLDPSVRPSASLGKRTDGRTNSPPRAGRKESFRGTPERGLLARLSPPFSPKENDLETHRQTPLKWGEVLAFVLAF